MNMKSTRIPCARAVSLTGAILRVSEDHDNKLRLVGKLNSLAKAAVGKLKDSYPDSQVIPPHVSVFIKSRQKHLLQDVPAVPNPLLDTIGVMDYTLAKDPGDKIIGFLMMQQVCRLVLAASNLGWRYNGKVQSKLDQRTNLLEGFFAGKTDLSDLGWEEFSTPVYDDKGIIIHETMLASDGFTPLDPKVRRDLLLGRLKNDQNLLRTFALGHMWDSRMSNEIGRLVNAFCLVIAARLTGFPVEVALNVLPYGGRVKQEDFGSRQGEIWQALIKEGYIEEDEEYNWWTKSLITKGIILPVLEATEAEFIARFNPRKVTFTENEETAIFKVLKQGQNRKMHEAVDEADGNIQEEALDDLFAGRMTYDGLKAFWENIGPFIGLNNSKD